LKAKVLELRPKVLEFVTSIPFGKGYPSIGFCALLGDSGLVKTRVAFKNQLLYPMEAARAEITRKVTRKPVEEKQRKSEVLL